MEIDRKKTLNLEFGKRPKHNSNISLLACLSMDIAMKILKLGFGRRPQNIFNISISLVKSKLYAKNRLPRCHGSGPNLIAGQTLTDQPTDKVTHRAP